MADYYKRLHFSKDWLYACGGDWRNLEARGTKASQKTRHVKIFNACGLVMNCAAVSRGVYM